MFPWQAQYFRDIEGKHRKTHWYEAVSFALNFAFLKDVSQNCFVFDVANFKNGGSLAGLLRFWCCQLQKMQKSRRISSFLMLPTSKIEEVSQNFFVFDVIQLFKNWRGLAEFLRFWSYPIQKLKRSRRTSSFLMLSNSKIEDVSQSCFVFDVRTVKNWGCLAELFRFRGRR